MDIVSKEKRSEIMSKIRGFDTRPEIFLKRLLESEGISFEYQPEIGGRPDFLIQSARLCIFVDGCFWHGCPRHFRLPKTNRKFWREKIERNRARRRRVRSLLNRRGYRVFSLWEHDLDVDSARIRRLLRAVGKQEIEH